MIAPHSHPPPPDWETIFQKTGVGLGLINKNGYFVGINPRFCQMIGYTASELLSRTLESITHPEDWSADLSQTQRLYSGEIEYYALEKRYIQKSGQTLWAHTACSLMQWGNVLQHQDDATTFPLCLIVIQNITPLTPNERDVLEIHEGKEAEALLVQNESTWKALADSMPQFAWRAQADGQRFWFNQRYFDYTGTTLEAVQGWGWLQLMREDIIPNLLEIMHEATQTAQPWEAKVAIRGKEGHYRWFLSRAQPILNPQGELLGWLGTNTDIHELQALQERLEKSQQELAQSNRDLEQFAAIACHDLQAPLRKAKTFCALIRNKVKVQLDADTLSLMDRVHASLENMQDLVSDLLKLSQVTTETQAFDWVDLTTVLSEVTATLSDIIEQTGAVIRVQSLIHVYGDERQLSQLLQNLLENALKYQPPGQRPEVDILAVSTESQHCQLWVKDNGIGFLPEHAERIFRPFERLHGNTSPYEGSGIGLAICHRIVERHQGRIWAESTPGKGTQFVVLLPPP